MSHVPAFVALRIDSDSVVCGEMNDPNEAKGAYQAREVYRVQCTSRIMGIDA